MHSTPLALRLLAAAPLVCATAHAQVQTLVLEGDMVAGVGLVTRIDYVDVNGDGEWLVEADTDNVDTNIDSVVLFNGSLHMQQGMTLNIPGPAGATLSNADVSDINSNGDLMFLLDINLQGGGTSEIITWNGMLLVERDVTPINAPGVPANSVWTGLSEAWQNSANQILIGGRTGASDDILVLIEHDGMGNITSETLLTIDGITMAGHNAPVTGLSLTKTRQAINDNGTVLWYVDDDNTTPGGMPNDNICCDSWVYMDATPLFNEADMVPPDMTRTFGHFSTAELDINNSGEWVGNFVLDSSDSSNNTIIFKSDNTVVAREGSAPPGIGGGFVLTSFGITPVQISEDGDVYWYGDWDDSDTDIDTGLFRNDSVLVQEGVSTIDGVVVDSFNTGSDSFAMSDNGTFLIFEATLVDGNEGAFLIGQLGENYCIGAANSVGAGATISAEGSATVSDDDFTLIAEGMPDTPGIFFFGPNQVQVPFGDGFRCVGGATTRIQPPITAVGGRIERLLVLGAPPAAGNIAAGSDLNFQCWYRDPMGPGGSGFNLTDGLNVLFD